MKISKEMEAEAKVMTVTETKIISFSNYFIERPITYKEAIQKLQQRGNNKDLRGF